MNEPTTFCNHLNIVFHDFIDKFMVVYLDDIDVYSETDEYRGHLRQVLNRLRKHV